MRHLSQIAHPPPDHLGDADSVRESIMTHALNLVLPIKQDAATLASLKELADSFPTVDQPLIEKAFAKSQLVHFGRVFVIDNKYIQVITEFEGSPLEYAEFFRKELTPFFKRIFALAEGAPDANDPNAFLEFTKVHHIRSLGMTTINSTDLDGNPEGWLFSAYDQKTVNDIQTALAKA
jgi:hypothetical protein